MSQHYETSRAPSGNFHARIVIIWEETEHQEACLGFPIFQKVIAQLIAVGTFS